MAEPTFADPPLFDAPGFIGTGPVAAPPVAPTRSGRRLELLRTSQERPSVRVVPGQLPTFERDYLVRELRQITLTATGLLAFIVLLAVVLR